MSAALQMLTSATCRRCAAPFEFLGNVTPDLCRSCQIDDERRRCRSRCAACGDRYERIDVEEFCSDCRHFEGEPGSAHMGTCRCSECQYPDSIELPEPEDD